MPVPPLADATLLKVAGLVPGQIVWLLFMAPPDNASGFASIMLSL